MDNSVDSTRHAALTALVILVGAVLGAVLGGGSGFLIGGLLCYVVRREWAVRGRLRRLEETETRLSEMRAWATEMKAWAEQAYDRLSDPRPGTDTPDTDTPDTDTIPDTDARPGATEPVVRPVASEPQAAARVDVPAPAAPAPPDPATRAPRPPVVPPATRAPAEPTPAERTPAEPTPRPAEPTPAEPTPRPAEPTPAEPTPVRAEATAAPAPGPPVAEPWAEDIDVGEPAPGSPPRQPLDPISRLVGAAKEWVTTGNAPVKVGVLVSLIGVGLLLREASQRGVINITLEMRLIAVALFGLALLTIGWRLRRKNPVYGVSLQGGGVAVLYLTTYASFAVYDVLPTAPAAVAVIAVTVGAGVLSVTQDSPPLAVLGITGGFLAPVLTYTSPHDHVWVFGFYAVLSATIVAVAWYKTWPLLNLLGLGFTFGIAGFWLWRRFDEGKWADVQPLIGVLILLYLAIPVLFAVREAPDLRRPSTAPLVFGTPFAGFGLQYLAVGHTEYGMAVSAAALALVHGLLAVVAHRLGRECRSLAEANVGLGAAFAVIAVPLAFDAPLTIVVWAVQGGLMAWIGCRRARVLAVAAGCALQALAGVAFLSNLWASLPDPDAHAIYDAFVPVCAVLAGTGLVTGRMVHRLSGRVRINAAVSWVALAWGSGWWIIGGLMEVASQLTAHGLTAHQLSVSLGFVVLSFAAASMSADRLRWPHLHALGAAVGPTLWVAAIVSLVTQQLHPLDRFGWAAWPGALAVFYWFLRSRERRFLAPGEDRFRALAAVLHGGAFWLVMLLAFSEVSWQTENATRGVWPIVAPAAAITALAAAALLGVRWLRWPLRVHRQVYVWGCAGPALVLAAVIVGVASLVSDGDPVPLPYVPVLNPLIVLLAALAGVAAVWAAAARSLRAESDGAADLSLWVLPAAGAGVALATMELARTVHHTTDVPWEPEALFNSTAFGVSLSILWALIGLAAMVAGARTGRRGVWVAGGGWMAVVLVKLVAIDLNILTAPGRAASFIGTGVLLLLVGYLAPAAPDVPSERDARADLGSAWLLDRLGRWLTSGNWPAQIGVVVSLVGAGLLLTEAAGQDLLESSIATRLVSVAAAGAVLLALGWFQREARPLFGLSLQGGGIAVLHVVVYAGYPVHGVIGAVPAGALVVAATASGVVLSVLQDSRVLVVLATIGGFLAPVLTYTGSGDHTLVFGFYAILSAAIVAVAWFKAWPELNLLGLASTFGIAAWWVETRFDPDDWLAVQPLIAVLVVLYMSIPAISVRRGSQRVHEMWMHPLVLGTPFIALGIQQLLVGHLDYALAISAAVLAVLLAGLVLVVRGAGAGSRELTATYAGLSTVFIAIAVPLALDGAYAATVWAAQGALLAWIGCRRGRILAVAGGGVLQVLAGVWFAIRLAESLPYGADVAAVANEYLMASAVLAVSGLVSGWRIHLASHRLAINPAFNPAVGALVLAWGAAWWLTGGLVEIGSQIPDYWQPATLAFVTASSGAAVAAAGPLRWPRLGVLGVLIPPVLVAALVVSLATQDHPLDRFGWAAWPVSMAIFYGCLRSGEQALRTLADRWRSRRHDDPPAWVSARGPAPLAAWLHAAGFWIVAVIVAVEVRWQIDQAAEGVWPLAVTVAAAMVVAGLPMAARRWVEWPFDTHWRTYTLACSGPLLIMLAVVVLDAAVFSDGDPSPLLYLPVANPLGVLVGMQLAVLLAWRRQAEEQWDHPFQGLVDARWSPTLFVLGVILATAETARTVRHWLDVPWDLEALWDSTALQTSLSILWAVIALSAMVAGVRMARRAVWVAGASWMAVVVAKLFLVDLRNLTAVGRVVSFIVVGVLLLIVGYLAPVPPAASGETDEE